MADQAEPDGQGPASAGGASELEAEVAEFVETHLPTGDRVDAASPKVVHDGLWGTLRLRPAEVRFIDTPLVQRLRQIRQMGCAHFTYPSATHSRFEHTLGVMLQVEKLGHALLETKQTELSESHVEHLRLAALCHDLGHGLLSHTSEEVYGNLPQLQPHIDGCKPHEAMSRMIVCSEPFRRFCQTVSNECRAEVPVDQIASCIVGQNSDAMPPYKRDLVNGPFDADKLDYLFRDSHFSGLPLSVDLDRLWYTVRIANARGQQRLVVTQSGATPLEQILFSRMMLFETLYHHHKVRACDCMFAGIVEYMRENGIGLPVRGRDLRWDSPVDFLWVTDGELLSFGFRANDDRLHSLVHDLFFRRPLKRALIVSRRTIGLDQEDDRWDDIQRHATQSPESFSERRNLAGDIWTEAGKPCLRQQVWVDLPELPSMRAADDTFVLPWEHATPIPLTDLFPTGKWVQQYGMNKWRGHVFCPAEHREAIGKAAKGIIEERYGVQVLPEAFTWCKAPVPN